MQLERIAIVNDSTVIKQADVPPVVDALQLQLHRDFAPIWGVDADLRIAAKPTDLAAGEWLLTILDNSDQAGALAYHDIAKDGSPLGKVFAKTDQYKWLVARMSERYAGPLAGVPGYRFAHPGYLLQPLPRFTRL